MASSSESPKRAPRRPGGGKPPQAKGKAKSGKRVGVSKARTDDKKAHDNALARINHHMKSADDEAREAWKKTSKAEKAEWAAQYRQSGYLGLKFKKTLACDNCLEICWF